MKIQPTDTPTPKYPVLAALAVAVAAALPACEQPLPQPTAGAPLPPPCEVKPATPTREMQRMPGRVVVPRAEARE